MRQGNSRKTQDALISATASSDANFLVTEDHSFATRVQKNLTNVQVLNFSELIKKVNVITKGCPR